MIILLTSSSSLECFLLAIRRDVVRDTDLTDKFIDVFSSLPRKCQEKALCYVYCLHEHNQF